MKRVIVTGAQGFLGRYMVDALLRNTDAIVLGIGRSQRNDTVFTHYIHIDRKRISAPLPLELHCVDDARYDYRSIDVRSAEAIDALLAAWIPDTIVHLASGLRGDDPSQLFASVVGGTMALFEATRRSGIELSRFVYASTGGVYGVPHKLPVDESMRCEPAEYYAVAKLAAEHVTQIAAASASIPAVIARIFNIVGPGQDERHVCGRIASQIVEAEVANERRGLALGDLTPTRDFIDVRDVARALALLAGDERARGIYNLASGTETSIRTVLDYALSESGQSGTTVGRTYHRAAEIPRHVANIERLRSLGFFPTISLQQSVRDLLMYYRRCIHITTAN